MTDARVLAVHFRSVPVLLVIGALAGQQAPAPARYYNPKFSADGGRVIFESTRDGKYTLYSINLDGTGLGKLTDGRQNDAQPQWSADGRLVTFTSEIGGLNKVFVMGAAGSDKHQVSTGPKQDAAPSFSPDGTHVAWAATTVDPVNWRDIGVAAIDGSGQRLITSGPGNDQSPVWISNTRIVFTREFPPKTDWMAMTPDDHAKRRASSEIMAVDSDGTHLVNLTQNEAYDGAAVWAARVARIFFKSNRNGSDELLSMTADGGDVRRVADATGITPDVSPDGARLAYSKIVNDRSGIYVRDLATGAERELIGGEIQTGKEQLITGK